MTPENNLEEINESIKEQTLALYQIYGELNRIRLIIGENSKRGQKIEKFDKEVNYYIPFFDNPKSQKKYKTKNDAIMAGKEKRKWPTKR